LSEVIKAKVERNQFSYGSLVGMLVLSVAGSTLAGMAFPAVLVIYELTIGVGDRLGRPEGGYLAAFVILGGLVGGMLALGVGALVATLAGAIAWLASIPTRSIWFASLIGGWTGFFAVHLILEALPRGKSHLTVIGLAVATGQAGAAALVVWVTQSRQVEDRDDEPAPKARFGLRQIFGITTAVAVLIALGQAFDQGSAAFLTLGFAAAVQSSTISLATLVTVVREKWR
jgi:hypothetical protein